MDFWWQISFIYAQGKMASNLSLPKLPKSLPHFPRQFITWNSLWGRLHVTIPDCQDYNHDTSCGPSSSFEEKDSIEAAEALLMRLPEERRQKNVSLFYPWHEGRSPRVRYTSGGVKQGRFVILCFALFCSVWMLGNTAQNMPLSHPFLGSPNASKK